MERPAEIDSSVWDLIVVSTESRRLGPFANYQKSQRVYPGEPEAAAVLSFLSSLKTSPRRYKDFVKPLRILQLFESATRNYDSTTMHQMMKRATPTAYDSFGRAIRRRAELVAVREQGLIVRPKTTYGTAALGVLVLFEKRLLTRIRQCLHCKQWFYARFTHQKFCRDALKGCQWKHYHSPEWRKANRERNRTRQAKFRERMFGRRKRS
jgi:hypothetical protein